MSADIRLGETLLAAIRELDYETIAGCFAPDASLRVLTPGPLREFAGPDEAAARFRHWLEPLAGLEFLESDVEVIADRVRIRYRFRGRDPEKGWQLNEHTAYAAMDAGRITAMNVTCTGFRPTSAPA